MLAANPYQQLGSTDTNRQRAWREFVLHDDPREEAIRRGNKW